MSDEVVGVAILDKEHSPQRLLVRCRTSSNGYVDTSLIPVYERGTPKPQTSNGAAWEYTVDGGTLHITPSLHVQSQIDNVWQTRFHNQYNWSVKFKVSDSRPVSPDWDAQHLYEQLREENP